MNEPKSIISQNLFYIIIILIISLAIILYYVYKYYFAPNPNIINLIKNPTSFKGEYQSTINLANYFNDNRTSINSNNGDYGFTLELDMYINNNSSNENWSSNFRKMKPIFNLSDNIILFIIHLRAH